MVPAAAKAGPSSDDMWKTSFEGRAALLMGLSTALAVGVTWWVCARLQAPQLGVPLGLLVGTISAVGATHWLWRPHRRALNALADGLQRLADRDFSAGIGAPATMEPLEGISAAFNALTEVMREERLTLFQRELLLDTVLQTSPLALLLTTAAGRVIYSNPAARQLFGAGRRIEGVAFDQLREGAPEALRDALARERDGLCTVEVDGQREVYHVSRRRFTLNAKHHQLYQIKQLTAEINRQEVATWKRVIRVISHELNNSLAPMRSLAHSGRQLLHTPKGTTESLELVFNTIVERAEHLSGFIQGYARFAKLPTPRPAMIDGEEFLRRLASVVTFRAIGPPPQRPLWADPAQLEQVMINLLKNAHESGTPAGEVELEIEERPRSVRLSVRDRGQGMSEETLRSALLPFYSTKRTGTGLGLPLCREIVEAHDGRLLLDNRIEGGVEVMVELPYTAVTSEPTMLDKC
ncbi:MAG: PAS domain-containing sensor histidine kinase [Pseudomonadota bacterium]